MALCLCVFYLKITQSHEDTENTEFFEMCLRRNDEHEWGEGLCVSVTLCFYLKITQSHEGTESTEFFGGACAGTVNMSGEKVFVSL